MILLDDQAKAVGEVEFTRIRLRCGRERNRN